MKWVYWGWTALGVGAVVFVFIGAHGWETEGYLFSGAEVFGSIVAVVVVPAWIAGYVIAWALAALVRRLTSATRRHRSIAKRV